MSKGIILYRNLSFFNIIYFLFVTKFQNILLNLKLIESIGYKFIIIVFILFY